MPVEPITHLEKTIAGTVEPVTHLEKVISEYGGGGGGGGSVTPASIVTATGQMTPEQAAQTRGNLGAAPAETVVAVSSTTPTIEPQANTIYNCGELTSLTISNPPATVAYSIVFTSGATATTTTIPTTILGLEDFAAEANTIYEINVLDNRSVIGSWAVSA